MLLAYTRATPCHMCHMCHIPGAARVCDVTHPRAGLSHAPLPCHIITTKKKKEGRAGRDPRIPRSLRPPPRRRPLHRHPRRPGRPPGPRRGRDRRRSQPRPLARHRRRPERRGGPPCRPARRAAPWRHPAPWKARRGPSGGRQRPRTARDPQRHRPRPLQGHGPALRKPGHQAADGLESRTPPPPRRRQARSPRPRRHPEERHRAPHRPDRPAPGRAPRRRAPGPACRRNRPPAPPPARRIPPRPAPCARRQPSFPRSGAQPSACDGNPTARCRVASPPREGRAVIVVSVASNVRKVIGGLDAAFAKQAPFATALALTRTAQAIPAALGAAARSVFDRPRPFTTGAGAMYVKRADKASLTAEVGYKDIQTRYLRWQIAGGARVQKGFERALTGLGLLPAGHVVTPGAGLKLDAFGNIPRAQLVQILGQLKSGVSVFAGRGKRMSRQGLFVILPGATAHQARHLTPGIWRRGEGASWRDRHAVPLIHYIEAAAYHPRLDLEGAARRVVDARFP